MDTYPTIQAPAFVFTRDYDEELIRDYRTDDGELVRIVKGPIRYVLELNYEGLSTTDKNTLQDFWENHMAVQFYFVDPETEATVVAAFAQKPSFNWVQENEYDCTIRLLAEK